MDWSMSTRSPKVYPENPDVLVNDLRKFIARAPAWRAGGRAVSSRLFSSSTVEALVLEPVKPPHPHNTVGSPRN